jgi:hypothetical protein
VELKPSLACVQEHCISNHLNPFHTEHVISLWHILIISFCLHTDRPCVLPIGVLITSSSRKFLTTHSAVCYQVYLQPSFQFIHAVSLTKSYRNCSRQRFLSSVTHSVTSTEI